LIFASLESFLLGESLSFEFSRKAYRGVATSCVGLVLPQRSLGGVDARRIVNGGESLVDD